MLPVALPLFAIVAILVGSALLKMSQGNAWKAYAAARGMAFTPGGFVSQPQMSGTHRGLSVVFDVEMRGSGKNRYPYTRCNVGVPTALPAGFALSEEGFFSGVSRFFGSQDIQIGDAELDKAAMIKGTDEAAVQRLLRQSAAREAALKVVRHGGLSRVEDNTVRIIRYGMCTDSVALDALLEAAVDAAAQFAEGARAVQ